MPEIGSWPGKASRAETLAIPAWAIGSNWRLLAGILLRLLLVISPVMLASLIALNTRPNAHCDEYIHVDTFEYFRTHWLMPAPGVKDVPCSINGISRVYNGEIVYFFFGKIGYFARRAWPSVDPYYIYRFCDVGLLLITLTVLATVRCKWFSPWLLGLFLFCIPQVFYQDAYANSDAFGVSVSVLLFVQAARMIDQSPREWGWVRIGIFMLLFLLTLLSKVAFVMGILLPAGLLVFHLWNTRTPVKWVLLKLIVPLLMVYAMASWWNPALSPRHSAWQKQMMAVREELATPGRRPSDPQEFGGEYPVTMKGLYIAANHGTYGQVLRFDNYEWFKLNAQSVYGQFGYMLVVLPVWIYRTVGYTALGLCVVTLAGLWMSRSRMSWGLMLCVIAAPMLIGLNLFGSIYHSFHFDWQPQGRYMFASLVPMFFLCFGACAIEGRWQRVIHGIVLAFLLPLSCYVLVEYVMLSPILRQ